MKIPDDKKKPTIHETPWVTKIAEMRLKGDTIFEAHFPIIRCLLESVGRVSVLCARSAFEAEDMDSAKKSAFEAKIIASMLGVLTMAQESGTPEKMAERMRAATAGIAADPGDEAAERWKSESVKIPLDDLAMMDSHSLACMRYSEDDETVCMSWDEVICGKNDMSIHAVREEYKKKMQSMGINDTPPKPNASQADKHEKMKQGIMGGEDWQGICVNPAEQKKRLNEKKKDEGKDKPDDDPPFWKGASDRWKN